MLLTSACGLWAVRAAHSSHLVIVGAASDDPRVNRQNASQREPRLFHLVRNADVSGVSGTGTVAEGVQWSDGAVAVRWRGRWPATSVWESGLDAVLAVHGHGGATVVRWLPAALPALSADAGSGTQLKGGPAGVGASPLSPGLRIPTASLDGLCAGCGRAWPCLKCGPWVDNDVNANFPGLL